MPAAHSAYEPHCERCRRLGRGPAAVSTQGVCLRCAAERLLAAEAEAAADTPATEASGPDTPTATSPGPDRAGADHGAPERAGPYSILDEIGRGGMGRVYLAQHRSLGRIVALKIFDTRHAPGDPELERRFLREARTASSLRHPHVVGVHEAGRDGPLLYLSMDYVEGPNLHEAAAEKPLPPSRTAPILRKAAEAVAYAHEHGVLHRDLKPSNILLDDDDAPKITDFGLARELEGGSELTLDGKILGTPGYMAPEQADPKFGALSPASDVYSLGAVLYFLLTGRAPFVGPTPGATLRQMLGDEPVKPSLLNPSAPQDLETICLKCLEKDPARRYRTATQLADELRRFEEGRPILARPVGALERLRRWGRREPAVARLAAAVLLLALALAAGSSVSAVRIGRARDAEQAQRKRAERTVIQLETQRAEDLAGAGRTHAALARLARVLRQDPGNTAVAARTASLLAERSHPVPEGGVMRQGAGVRDAEFSPDGSLLATCGAAGGLRLWSVGRPDHPAAVLGEGLTVTGAFFSPDGARVYALTGEGRVLGWPVAAPGKPALNLGHDGPLTIAAISRDGRVIATAGGNVVRTWLAADGTPAGPPLDQSGGVSKLDISADGRWVLCDGGGPVRKAFLWDVPSGRLLAETNLPPALRLYGLEFSPDASLALVADYEGRLTVWETPGFRPLFDHRLGWVIETAGFSPDGRRVVTGGRDGMARLWEARTGALCAAPMHHPTLVTDARFSADGRVLLTTCGDDTVWLWDAATGAPWCEPLNLGSRVAAAAISPDARRIATSLEDGAGLVWDIRPGAQLPLRLPTSSVTSGFPYRDARRVLVWGVAGDTRVWDVSERRPLTPPLDLGGFGLRGALSPDERRFAAAVYGEGCSLWDAATGRQLAVVRREAPPGGESDSMDWVEFSPDGRLFATGDRAGGAALWAAEGGRSVGRAMISGRRLWMAHFSPRGDRLATAAEDGAVRIWDTRTQEPVTPVMRHDDAVYCANFSPDGLRIVTASYDLTARVWNAVTGAPIGPPLRHHSGVRWAEFSPDGAWIVTASSDNTARLWDAATHEPVGEPMLHQGPVWRAHFTRAGRWVATASLDGSARVWAAPSGQPVTDLLRHKGWPTGIAPIADGAWIGLGQSTGGFDLRELPPDGVAPPWLADLAEAVAGERYVEAGFEAVPPERLAALAEAARHSAPDEPWSRLRAWFFADRERRTISPSSPCPVADWADFVAAQGGYEALSDVYRVAPGRPGLGARLTELAAAQVADARNRPADPPDYFARWLLSAGATNVPPAIAPTARP